MPPQAPPFGKRLGLLYKRWVLDCIVYLGYAVSKDFSKRPELYQAVKKATANKLTDIQSQYGYAADFPNTEIRQMLMQPVFGVSDGHGNGNDGSPFQVYRMPVLAAAADFSETAVTSGLPMLRERIRSSAKYFIAGIVVLKGASFDQTEKRMTAIFDTAQEILKDDDVSGVFGIPGSIDLTWPLKSNDLLGATLIENMTNQLPDMPYGVISREQFVRMQRIAEKGEDSIFRILETDIEKDDKLLDQLIAQLYAWGSDLGLVGGARPQQPAASTQPPYAAASGTTPSP